jgi:hypothetical protein
VKKAYIFRGPPAAGKSTSVPLFAKSLGGKVAYLSEDAFRWNFHLIGREVPDVSPAECRLAFENMLLMLEQYCKAGDYQLVIDGLFTWDDPKSPEGSVQDVVDVLKRYGFEYHCFVLTAEKPTLLRRNEVRDYTVPPDEFERLWAGIYQTIDGSELVCYTDKGTPEDIVRSVKEELQLSS